MRLGEAKSDGYLPNQDQNVIQHTALIFVGRWSVVLSIVDSIASPPDLVRRDLIRASQQSRPLVAVVN